ncbi:MAG TPA: Hsp20/alpha crystallin family protein [Bacilli bacterium]|jgi:HSP20 family protein|nr:Hsp20/alpha crystallin family protein [Acholeplasmataceae bacterium]OQB66196.1 MAG: Spore protein SP21 [Tenericutes bacterium ADurb.Bin140]HOE77098.1 Hsp20/alpha crystallin family protein [Bacilli bacterium]HON64029.1 Hsp20/alpha crystallin family protein [Bacilli bacterium]HOR95444.1 Hsp20/alpha crystallin family protein [Bacilli bacterium]
MRFDSTFDLLNQLFDDCWFEDDAARTDIYEDEKAFYIDIEVPGVKKEAINVKLDNENLVIDVKEGNEKEEKDYTFYEKGRVCMNFTRKYKLPSGIDEGNIKVKLEDGVLSITLMKSEKMLPKTILIE